MNMKSDLSGFSKNGSWYRKIDTWHTFLTKSYNFIQDIFQYNEIFNELQGKILSVSVQCDTLCSSIFLPAINAHQGQWHIQDVKNTFGNMCILLEHTFHPCLNPKWNRLMALSCLSVCLSFHTKFWMNQPIYESFLLYPPPCSKISNCIGDGMNIWEDWNTSNIQFRVLKSLYSARSFKNL